MSALAVLGVSAAQLSALAGSVLVALLAGLLGGGAVVVKWLDRDVTRATANRTDVETLRGVVDEVLEEAGRQRERGDRLERRVGVLEERERHMLTRAAVHEAWDQFAFAALIAQNPQHPPPPPLTAREEVTP